MGTLGNLGHLSCVQIRLQTLHFQKQVRVLSCLCFYCKFLCVWNTTQIFRQLLGRCKPKNFEWGPWPLFFQEDQYSCNCCGGWGTATIEMVVRSVSSLAQGRSIKHHQTPQLWLQGGTMESCDLRKVFWLEKVFKHREDQKATMDEDN